MKGPGDAIVWEDGPQDRNYAYHKVATYDAGGGRLKIDVFVAALRLSLSASPSLQPLHLAPAARQYSPAAGALAVWPGCSRRRA